jgi:calcineurin-like phosphoesterase family protein
MIKTFLTADQHFGHEAILRYEKRPFKDLNDMDNGLIRNWNNTVGKHDRVFVLGDFSLYDMKNTKEILKSLNGIKFLIMGNHDELDIKSYVSAGFETVYDYPIIIDEFWILSHEPLYVNANMPYANIYGHVHTNTQYTDFGPQSFCVCVERTEYKPINFDIVKNKILKASGGI